MRNFNTITIFITALALSSGCAHSWRLNCTDTAVCTAIAVGKFLPVRVVCDDGRENQEDQGHAQGQVFIDGEWTYLILRDGVAFTVREITGFTPTEHYELDEFIKDEYPFINNPRFEYWKNAEFIKNRTN